MAGPKNLMYQPRDPESEYQAPAIRPRPPQADQGYWTPDKLAQWSKPGQPVPEGYAPVATATPSAPEDPIQAQADKKYLMQEVRRRVIAKRLEADAELRRARTPQAGGRLDYGLIHQLEQKSADHARLVNEISTLTNPNTLDQTRDQFDASQQSLAGNYAGAYINHRNPNFVGPLTPALESARGFFQPKQYDDPEIVAKRAALAEQRHAIERNPELRAHLAQIEEERQIAAAQATMRGNDMQARMTESNASPELTKLGVDASMASARRAPELINLAADSQAASYRMLRSDAESSTDDASLEQTIKRNAMQSKLAQSEAELAATQSNFDQASWGETAKGMNAKLSDIHNMDDDSADKFVDDYFDSVVAPLEELAKQGAKGKQLAARLAKSARVQPTPPSAGIIESALKWAQVAGGQGASQAGVNSAMLTGRYRSMDRFKKVKDRLEKLSNLS